MNIYVKILLFSVFTLLVQHLGRLFYQIRSYGNDVYNHHPGKCEIVEGFSTAGSEDITTLPSGKMIITSGLVGLNRVVKEPLAGALYLLDPSVSTQRVEKLNLVGLSEDDNFLPHGIDHWVHANGSVSVFVVAHQPESVMRFSYDGKKTLTLDKIYQNKTYMISVNSVFVTGEDSFYFSNLMGSRFGDELSMTIEYALILPASSIVYVQGDNYQTAESSILSANGITGDNRFIYAACKDFINIYTRLPDRNLRLYKSIPVNIGSMDNIKLDSDGSLWIGCQPLLYAVLDRLNDRSLTCPSEVLRIRDPHHKAIIESVFRDDGNLVGAATVAVYVKEKAKLYVGSMDSQMAVCDVNYLPNN